MVTKQILVVEDDFAIRQGIVDALEFEGYEVLEADRGDTGMEMALSYEYDLLLLDLVLPEHSGLEILQEVRSANSTQPVIILTARGEENDRVQGLRLGADDYVVKPFSIKELLARIDAVLRRSPERPKKRQTVAFDGGVIDFSKCEIRFADEEKASLSEREVALLQYLVCHANRAISREEILTRVWKFSPGEVETRTIDMHIARLREKLRDSSSTIISTVRGKGYMFGEK
ncbi:response regulator transcription factor [Candidatus Uabimicrobium amorphum]|uniref:DNA-binding response regulator n=1 Tax=Uabimicrobium amorphum TaxID=2596890 RepID=A0A5S9INK6_UABAM|nr:response regulator transcription factor [Candidatus Uabimicrobium amorphum]BBM85198.1 DNA-binding response regulator [Candidatus Uabimicrobium amorphum]